MPLSNVSVTGFLQLVRQVSHDSNKFLIINNIFIYSNRLTIADLEVGGYESVGRFFATKSTLLVKIAS